MPSTPGYALNDERFLAFRELQRRFVGQLARHPGMIRAWLNAQPARTNKGGGSRDGSKSWRAVRLNLARRETLTGLLAQGEAPGADPAPLAAWLLGALPVRTYLKMADAARPSLAAVDPEADRCCRELIRAREELLLANYGLARIAARERRSDDYDDRMSAAACGLLDAIDRYVPGERAARFSYFASYWIRYHLSRQALKASSLVSYPVHQYRMSRRIARYVAEHPAADRPPSAAQIRADLKLGANASCWYHPRPEIVSLHSPLEAGRDSATLEHYLSDPAPAPAAVLDEAEAGSRLRTLLRARTPPATRLMLAYTHGVGALPEAAEDYLAHIREQVRERIRLVH